MPEYKGRLFVDLDGCYLGQIMSTSPELQQQTQGKHFGIRPPDTDTVIKLLGLVTGYRLDVHFLTFRPPAQVFLLAHSFESGAYHLAEGGATAVFLGKEKFELNPLYNQEVREAWPMIAKQIEERLLCLGPNYFSQSGNRQLTGCYLGPDVELLASQIADCLGRAYRDLVVIKVGHGVVDVMPKEYSKLKGIQWAEQLHPDFYRDQLFGLPLLYLDDSGLEPTVAHVTQGGGRVGCPSNAPGDFKEIVRRYTGFVANEPYEQGCFEILRTWCRRL